MSYLTEALLVGGSQGILLSLVILSLPSGNPLASRLLASYVALESLLLLLLHVTYMQPDQSPPVLARLLFTTRALSGPALYLYVCALTEPGYRLQRRHLAHLWVLVFSTTWFVVHALEPEWMTLSTRELQLLPETVAMSSYQSLLMLFYALAARQRLLHHDRRVKQALSALDSVGLRWLLWLVTALIAVSVAHLSLDVLRLQDLIDAPAKAWTNLAMTLTVVYLISLGGLRQPQVFTEPVRVALAAVGNADSAGDSASDERKYQKSGLDDARRAELWAQLQALMNDEEPYLNPTLDLPKLAAMMSVRPQDLSEVINSQYGGSFYDLINHCRIDAAKRLLSEPGEAHRKMLDIALSVGFSSQSTYYNQFKKLTGMTPTTFRQAAAD
ncbi:MAG: helix-turn-helix transcriptional regulator [Spongiibacteraceae bacterium]|jgi:AraC-like DNA-binding protein|nr:helix-turn-helix transcriptional regulator [Spongiibacteraceae bacterium]